MTKEKSKQYLTIRKDKIIHIGCCLVGAIVVGVVCREAVKRHNYIVTNFTVGDLGKLGECLVGRGHDTTDRVLKWMIIAEKK